MTDSMPQAHWESISVHNHYGAASVLHTVRSRRETEEFPASRAKEYVCSLFPQFADCVDSVKMFKNENTAFCTALGCPAGVGGCYYVNENFILICWNPIIEYELVACHELLHFVSRLCGSSVSSIEQEENFAFSKSIRFALSFGKDIAWVRDVYMKPFYVYLARSTLSTKAYKNGTPRHVMSNTVSKLADDLAVKNINALITKEIGPGAFSMAPRETRPLFKEYEDDEDSPLSYL